MIKVGEFREGMPLSELIQLAVNDGRKAVATGKYVMEGCYWHAPFTGECAICLGGGVLAGLCGFESSRHADELQIPGRSLATWETDFICALDDVRGGYIEHALDRLRRPISSERAMDAVLDASVLIRDNFQKSVEIAPLETYEAAAQILAEVGL